MGDDASIRARPRLPTAAVPIGPGGGAPLGDLGDLDKKTSPLAGVAASRFSRTRGDGGGSTPPTSTPPGTALERKKSYHPDLHAAEFPAPVRTTTSASDRGELFVLPREGPDHTMELIHLNRTCTSVDLATAAASAAGPHGLGHDRCLCPRTVSDANITDEEKVHRVRHQVSLAHDVGHEASRSAAAGRHRPAAFHCDELVAALRSRMMAVRDAANDSDQEHGDEEDPDTSPDNGSGLEGEDEREQEDQYAFLDGAKLSPDSDADYLAVRPSLASTQLNEIRGPN